MDRGVSLGDEGLPEYGITPHRYQFGGCAIRGSFTQFTGQTTEIPQDTPEKNLNLWTPKTLGWNKPETVCRERSLTAEGRRGRCQLPSQHVQRGRHLASNSVADWVI